MQDEMTPKNNKVGYSFGEELANSITHGIGALLSVAALVLLVVFAALRQDPWSIVSFSIFGISLILLYLSSTLYHSFPDGKVKNVFQVLDHSAIFLLIAGTYTPILLITMRTNRGVFLLVLIWVMAVLGILFKVFFWGKLPIVSTLYYVLMGWLAVLVMKPLLLVVPLGMVIWIAVGGFCYTIGVIFYALEKLPYNHAVWHLFVMAGSIAHFFSMFLYLA